MCRVMAFNLKFYGARLRQASVAELFYRLRAGLNAWYSNRMVRKGKLPCSPPPDLSYQSLVSLVLPQFHAAVTRDMVRDILQGACFCHGYDQSTLQQWQKALEAKSTDFCSSEAATADIRTVWEPARLQHLTLLLVYLVQHDDKTECAEIELFIKREVLAWLEANPFLKGLHYRSAMECGLRIPVFFYCLRLLHTFTSAESKRLSDAVFLHAWWIERNLSLFSSRGNHTVCEASGLVFAGLLFRDEAKGRSWMDKGIRLLRQELDHQILADGGPLEQSFAYHRFVMDLYWLTLDLLEQNNLHQCRDMRNQLLEGERFLSLVSYGDGSFPSVGDDDGGYAIAPAVTPCRGIVQEPDNGCYTFDSAGYTAIRGNSDLRVLFDHGPLGMPPLYNHGHADALSVTLAMGGDELLIDSGTFRYNGAPAERAYFKGTGAHNTVVVDGFDQAEQVTGFIWKSPFSSRLLRKEQIDGGFLFEAEHTGYARLQQPVMHRRTLIYTPQKSVLLKDQFVGDGEHEFSLQFHLHPDALVNEIDGWWRIDRAGGTIWLKLLDDFQLELLQGEENSLTGWYAPSYGIKQPAPTLRCRRRGLCRSVQFRTFIRLRRM